MKRQFLKRRRGFFGSTAFTRRGASIIEVLISVTIVVISAMAAASFFAGQAGGARNSRQRAACMAALDAQIAYFRAMPNGSAVAWEKDSASSALVARRVNQTWFDDSVILPPAGLDTVPPAPAGAGREYKPYLLQQGSMGVLGALMHYQPGICAGAIDISSIPHRAGSAFPVPVNTDALQNFRTSIQIQPYDLITNGTGACDMKWARAQGSMDSALATANPPLVTFGSDTSKDIGYRLKLQGTYDTPNGPATCKADADFSFPVDRKVPAYSAILNVFDTSIDAGSQLPANAGSYIGARGQCNHQMGVTPASLDLHIGFNSTLPEGKIEPGTVFLCRDASTQINGDFCPPKGSGDPNAHMHGNDWPLPGAPPQWVPCDQVTACGIQPSTSAYVQNAANTELKYVNHYQSDGPGRNQPDGLWGCDIRVDVASVDPSGNFRMLSQITNPYRPITTAEAGKYYQPVECWACYKKKSSLFGAIIAFVAIAVGFGLIGAALFCATGGGGICKPNHTKFLGNYCDARFGTSGSKFCKKVNPKYPAWFGTPTTGRSCPASTGNTYPGSSMTYDLPAAPDGDSAEDTSVDESTGAMCQLEAVCDNGSWIGYPSYDDATGVTTPGTTSNRAACGKIYTGHKLDITSLPVGGSTTNGPAVCNVLIPDASASKFLITPSTYWGGYKKCSSYQTGLGYDALCQPYYSGGSWRYNRFPIDAKTQAPGNTNPNNYFYFQYETPVNFGLPECS